MCNCPCKYTIMTYTTDVYYAVKTTKELIHWGVIFYVHRKPVIRSSASILSLHSFKDTWL